MDFVTVVRMAHKCKHARYVNLFTAYAVAHPLLINVE